MPSDYEKQLRQKAQTFTAFAASELGVALIIDESGWGDYHLLLDADRHGKFHLYYSPKRDFYSLVPKGKVARDIPALWERLAAEESKPAVLKQAKSAYQAFVDGAYDNKKKSVGYGVVILHNGDEVARQFGSVNKYKESHQIAGELGAAMRVIGWCQENNVAAIDIFYDYKGIENWVTGAYKTEKPMARDYANYMRQSGVTIHWHKVDSHTGDYWNEIADKLAKKGTKST